MNLSPYFTRQEMERSQTAVRHGIANIADVREITDLADLYKLHITFRSWRVADARVVGGKPLTTAN